MSRPKRNGKWLVMVVVVLVVVIGVSYESMTGGQPVMVATAARGTVREYVEEKARTTVPRLYHVTMPINGRILPIEVAAGERVAKGQVLARLEADDWTDALKEATALVGAMEDAQAVMDAKIQASEAMLSFSKWIMDAKTRLYEQNQTSEIEEKEARRDYEVDMGGIAEDKALKSAVDGFLSIARLLPIYVKRQLGRSTVASPIDGLVLKRHVWNEQVLQAGAPLLDVADLSTLEITADLLTEQTVRVRPGHEVEIFGESIGKEPLRGRVRLIEPLAFTKVSSLGVEQQRAPVRISFDQEAYGSWQAGGKSLGLEYRVQVRIITAEREDALIVPRTVLFRNDRQQWQAYVVRDGKAELVTLRLGLLNDEEAEVLEGLAEGDQVIIAPDAALRAGTRVRPSA